MILYVLCVKCLNQNFSFLTNVRPRTIPLSPNAAYCLQHESITHKGFGEFTQEGITFDRGSHKFKLFTSTTFTLSVYLQKNFAFFDPNVPSVQS